MSPLCLYGAQPGNGEAKEGARKELIKGRAHGINDVGLSLRSLF